MSRVGNKPVELPEKVTFNVSDNGHLTVEGPLGKLELQLPEISNHNKLNNGFHLFRLNSSFV